MKWENIDDYHKRAKVQGGWLVKAYENVHHEIDGGGYDFRVSMCFVPDKMHLWKIDD